MPAPETAPADVRTMFPDATGEPVPDDLLSIVLQDVKSWWGSGPLPKFAASAGIIGLVLIPFSPTLGWLVLMAVVLYGLYTAASIRRHYEDGFWQGYARSRGLSFTGRPGGWSNVVDLLTIVGFQFLAPRSACEPPCDVPVLRLGDRQRVVHMLSGRIGPTRGHIATYTWRDTPGDGSAEYTNFDMTFVALELPDAVAARYPGVYLYSRSAHDSYRRSREVAANDMDVELESTDFSRHYRLRAHPQQDRVALYELFSTPFMMSLVDRAGGAPGSTPQWEQEGRFLVVYGKGHFVEASDVDDLVRMGLSVYGRYEQEYQ